MTRMPFHCGSVPRRVVGICCAVLTVTLTGCGAPAPVPHPQPVDETFVAEATANVQQYFANAQLAPTLAPVSHPDVLRGKKLLYLSGTVSSPAGSAGLQALREIKDLLGFNLVVFDGQGLPSKYQEGLRQAVAQRVDAVLLYGIDCPGNEAALREVRAAGIKVVGLQSVDCNEVNPKAQSLFDAQPLYPIGDRGATVVHDWAANGSAQADYLIARLHGKVNVIQFDYPDFAVTAALGKGFRDRMSECVSCVVEETVNLGMADFGPKLQQRAEQALVKHPRANALEANTDDLMTLGVSAAIRASGLKDELLTIAGSGRNATMDMIRRGDGLLSAGWVQDFGWDHRAGVDAVLRVLSDDPPAVSGIPVILYDRDQNMPASGPWMSPVDFRAVFDKAWGLK